MATPAELNELSILDLVASDGAYKTLSQYNQDRAAGGPVYLQSFPDSASVADEQGIPLDLVAKLPNGASDLTAHQLAFRDGASGGGPAQTVTFTKWVLIKKFQNDSDGFGAAIFKSTVQKDGKDQFIVAFQGSDGTDAQDWFANLDLARKVWKDRGPEVIDFLVNGGIGDDGVNYRFPGKQPSLGVINFTGQSLGGGLAQYGAYFYAKQLDAQGQASNLSQRMSLIEFNSFGAVAGIDDVANAAGGFNGLLPSRYDKNLLADVPTIHYAIDNDIVHRLGTGNPADLTFLGSSWHVNGSGNSYTFDFQRFDLDRIPVTGEQSKLNLVDAHRIESGFYRGFANYGSTFASAANLEHANYSYIDTDLIQNTGALLSRMFSNGTSSNLSAKARTVLGVLGASAIGPISELQGLQIAIVGALYDAGDINAAERAALSVGASPITIKAVVIQAAGTLSKALGAAGWLISIGMELFQFLSASDKQAIIQEENKLLPADRQIQYQNVSDPQATPVDWEARYETYSLFAAQYADAADRVGVLNTPARQRLADDLFDLDIDPAEFGAKVIDGDNWISDTAILVESKLVSSGVTPEQWAKVNGDLIAFFAGEAQKVRVQDAATADRMEAALEQFTKDGIGRALANTKSDFSDKYILADASAFGATQFDFIAYDSYRDALEQAASNPDFSEIAPLIEEALEIVEAAGEVVDLEAERPAANPFDTPGFDPDAARPPSGQVNEGGIKRFTLSLPYGAGEGGQRIAIALDGTAAPYVKLLAGAEEVVAQDGVYTVVVEEGRREVELAVWGQIDVTENGTLAVSATLVDAAGQATHQTHIEANVEFVARNDRVFEGSPGLSGDESQTLLIGGSGSPGDRGIYVDFRGGDDVIWGYFGDDRILGGAGDDRLFGSFGVYIGTNDRDWLSGGPGDDQLLGGEGDDILDGDSGSDLLLGDVGDDFLFGGSKADYATIFTVGGFDLEGNTLQGGAGKDLVVGSGGGDALSGGNDADLIFGGAGNDVIRGDTEFFPTHTFQIIGSLFPPVQPFAGGPDVLYGNAGSDTLYGEAGDDLLYGGDGDDSLIGGEGRDTLYGGAGNDFLVGDSDDLALALPGGDFLDGGEGDDRLSGQGGADTLTGGRGNDVLDGGAGNDTYIFSSGDGRDIISEQGVAGSDVLVVNNYAQGEMTIRRLANGSVRLTGANGDEITISRMVGDPTPGIELVQFADGTNLSVAEIAAQPIAEDSIGGDGWTTLSDQDDTVYTIEIPINDPGGFVMVDAGGGNDTVFGGPNAVVFGNDGDDTLIGGETLLGGEGNDYLAGAVTLIGGPGDDQLLEGAILSGGPGSDFLDGGFGPDRYLLRVEELGQDTIADSHGLTLEQFAGWYYPSINIPDWEERLFIPERDGSVSVEEGIALGLLPPLAQIAANDYAALAPLYTAGVIALDTIEFGEGITPAGSMFSWGDVMVSLDPNNPDGVSTHATLDISWDTDATVSVVIPRETDPLGSGIERFRFVDGAFHSLAEMIAAAPAAPDPDALLIIGTEDSDLLVGTSQNEHLRGLGGGDALYGAAGDDYVEGGKGDDILNGGSGADVLLGGAGADFVEGDAGNDFLDGGLGDDTYVFNPGDGVDHIADVAGFDTLLFGDGITPDMLTLGLGSLEIHVGGSGDAIHIDRFDPDNVIGSEIIESFTFADGTTFSYGQMIARGFDISGTPDEDILSGTNVDDRIDGLGGDDQLQGSTGADTLSGGSGNDFLNGGLGDDTYVFDPGDGVDHIADAGGSDTLEFGDGITLDMLTLRPDSPFIRVGDNGDAIHIEGFNPDDVLGSEVVESFRFSDGTTLSYIELVARGFDITGTADDDILSGTNVNDRIDALDGNDTLYGLAGDDRVDGGVGDDAIEGGTGSDVLRGGDGADYLADWEGNNFLSGGTGDDYLYADGAPDVADNENSFVVGGPGNDWIDSFAAGNVIAFSAGDGQDTVYAANSLTLSLGGGIDPATLSLSQDGTDLVLAIGVGDSIRLTRQFEPDPQAWPEITLQMFGSVHLYDFNAVIAEFQAALSAAPSLVELTLDGVLQAHETSVSETDAFGGALAYQYGTTGNLNGLSDAAIRQVLADANFGTAPQTIEFGGANQAPTLDNPIADQMAQEDAAFSFTVPANTFADVDAGDTFAYSATLVTGDPLPAWLTYNPTTQTFSGTPANGDVRAIAVRVTATDSTNASVSDVFDLTVANTNDVPMVANPITDQSASEDAAFSFQVPANTFADVDIGDMIACSASLVDGTALPSWLAFNAATRAFSGTPVNGDVGTLDLRVTATDGANASVSDVFSLTVINTKDAPIVAIALADQNAAEDAPFNFQVPANAFTDVDVGDALSYSATLADGDPLPAWLSFNATTRAFSGTPANEDVGTVGVKVTATDTGNLSDYDTFDVTVANTNDAPTVANAMSDQNATEDAAFRFTVPTNTFAEVDAGDTLTYSATRADGSALPAWLTFNAAIQTFGGTPANEDVGTFGVKVTATDGSNASVPDTFELNVINTNDTPVAAADGVAVKEDATTVNLVALLLGNDTDPDVGDTHRITAVDTRRTVGRVSFDAATQTLTYAAAAVAQNALAAGTTATDQFTYAIADAQGAGSSAAVTVTVTGVNDTPILVSPLADQSATGNQAFRFQVPGASFSDVDVGDPLAYRATLADGRPLPSWLVFDAASRNFSGTPAAGDVGAVSIRVTASDRAGASATDDFQLVVSDGGKRHEVNPVGTDHYDDRGQDYGTRDDERHGKPDGSKHDDRDDDRSDHKGDRMADCLAAYVESKPHYDFETLAHEFERSERRGEELKPLEIARRWQVVGQYAGALANEHDEDARGGADNRVNDHGLLGGGVFSGGFGYSGSTGAPHRIATLQTLQGLEEGFQRLHNR